MVEIGKKIDIVNFLQRNTPLILGIFLIFLLVSLSFIFYKFIYLVIIQEPKVSPQQMEFRSDLLKHFQGKIKDREETLKRIEAGGYRDIFNP